jgi:2-oxoglutarate/2-oxoacid ferredoxin oxidoreductase subunit beta
MIRYERSKGLTEVTTHYCPGCTHGILHKLVAEVLEELGVIGQSVGVASVGCSVFSYDYINTDFQQAPHGRACATATGIKRFLPDRVVFTYQGDGDLGSIGIAESIHAANRGENITVILLIMQSMA